MLDHQRLTLIVAVATLVITGLLYWSDSEGLLSRPGYGPHPGRFGSDRGGLLPGDGRASAATGGGDPYRSRRAEPVFLHWRGWQQRYAEQRALPDQPETPRPANRHSDRDHSPAADGNDRHSRRHPIHAARAGPDSRQHGQPYAVSIHDGERGLRRPLDMDAEIARRASPAARSRGRCQQPGRQWPGRVRHHRSRQCRTLSASASAPSTTRSTMRSGSGSSRPFSRNRTNTASSWKPIPPRTPRSIRWPPSMCPRRPAARCRCRRSPRSISKQRPLLINHLAQFPATTVSFNLARAPRSAPPSTPSRRPRASLGIPDSIRTDFPGRGARISQQPCRTSCCCWWPRCSSCTSFWACCTRASFIRSPFSRLCRRRASARCWP